MERLDGKKISAAILEETKKRIIENGKTPGLAVLLVGNDPASHLYVGLKEKRAAEIGIRFEKLLFPEDVKQEIVERSIKELNARPDIHGIILQLPLPGGLDTDALVALIDPEKDADGFHPVTLKRLADGDRASIPVFPEALVELSLASGKSLAHSKSIVLAHSELFGKIMTRVLELFGSEAEYVSSEDKDFLSKLKGKSFVFVACGKPKIVRGEDIDSGTVILDGGINTVGGVVCGDVDIESLGGKEGYVSPVPGGVGPVTIACLLRRVLFLSERK